MADWRVMMVMRVSRLPIVQVPVNHGAHGPMKDTGTVRATEPDEEDWV